MKVRYFLPIGVFLAIAFISAIAMISVLNGGKTTKQIPSPLIGKNAPELVLPHLADGQEASDISVNIKKNIPEGKPFMVNFFASWCAPCQKEIPLLEKLSKNISIIGVAYKDNPDDLAIFLERFGNPFMQIGFDNDGKTAIKWGVYGIPEIFLISDEGKIIMRHAGEITHEIFRSEFAPKINGMIE